MRKILVTGDFEIAEGVFPNDVELIHIRCPENEQQILAVLPDIQDYILGGPEYISSRWIDIATRLENVVVMGTGTASFVDIEYATKKNVRIANTPHMNIQAVVEFTLAMMTTCLAKVFESIERVKDGTQWVQTPWRSLSNLSFGFVGMGGIGSEMAAQLHRRGCREIRYWSRNKKVELEGSLGLKYDSLAHMVNSVDVLCILITSCDETYHLIDEAVLMNASPTLKIFNLSYSHVICPVALKRFLSSNPDTFCFIDGYYKEWVANQGQHKDEYGLLALPSTSLIVTSHLAAQEKDTIDKMFTLAAARILELGRDCIK